MAFRYGHFWCQIRIQHPKILRKWIFNTLFSCFFTWYGVNSIRFLSIFFHFWQKTWDTDYCWIDRANLMVNSEFATLKILEINVLETKYLFILTQTITMFTHTDFFFGSKIKEIVAQKHSFPMFLGSLIPNLLSDLLYRFNVETLTNVESIEQIW